VVVEVTSKGRGSDLDVSVTHSGGRRDRTREAIFLAQCEPLPFLWGVEPFSGGSASLPWTERSGGGGWFGFPPFANGSSPSGHCQKTIRNPGRLLVVDHEVHAYSFRQDGE